MNFVEQVYYDFDSFRVYFNINVLLDSTQVELFEFVNQAMAMT